MKAIVKIRRAKSENGEMELEFPTGKLMTFEFIMEIIAQRIEKNYEVSSYNSIEIVLTK